MPARKPARPQVAVRPAEVSDASAIAHVYIEVSRTHASELSGSHSSSSSSAAPAAEPDVDGQRKRFEAMIVGRQRHVLVAVPSFAAVTADPEGAARTPVCGFISFGPSYTLEGHGEIMQLFVHPAWQRRGVGLALLRASSTNMEKQPWAQDGMHVWGSRGNPGNLIYERNGWVTTGREKTIESTLAGKSVPVVEFRRCSIEPEPSLWSAPWTWRLAFACLVVASSIAWPVLAAMSWPGIWQPILQPLKYLAYAGVGVGTVIEQEEDGQVPNVGILVKVKPSSVGVTHAGCLDGSWPAYYYRPQHKGPNRTKWILYFQGGGWCSLDENAWPSSFRSALVEHCRLRANTSLGSTAWDEATLDLSYKGLFSQDESINPTMHDWNLVLLRYCDGTSFTSRSSGSLPVGHRAKKGDLHFEGLANLDAILAHLMRGVHDGDRRFQDLSQATQVVVTGASAGGVAAAVHSERIRAALPDALVVALLDSAVFPDWWRRSHETIRPGQAVLHERYASHGHRPECIWPLHEQLRIIFETFGAMGAMPQRCIERHGKSGPWRCFFLEHLLPTLAQTMPVFVLQPRFDSSNVRLLDWRDCLGAYGLEVEQRLKLNESTKAPVGVFLDACFHHGRKWSEIEIGDVSQPQAFEKFMIAAEAWHIGATANDFEVTWMRQDFVLQELPCKQCCLRSPSAELGASTVSEPQRAAFAEAAEEAHAEGEEHWLREFSEERGTKEQIS